jgi:hypothetical protein
MATEQPERVSKKKAREQQHNAEIVRMIGRSPCPLADWTAGTVGKLGFSYIRNNGV